MVRESWADAFAGRRREIANDILVNKPFHEQLSGYFSRYRQDQLETVAITQFVAAVNQELAGMRAPEDSFHPLTETLLREMLEGKKGPTASLLRAFSNLFLAKNIGFYGDEREGFAAAGTQAVTAEEERRNRLSDYLLGLRSTNPQGDSKKRSFTEILEESHARRDNFVQFLFERLLPEWDNMSQVKFVAHIKALNERHPVAPAAPDAKPKDTFTDKALSDWHSGDTHPNRENIDVLCRAFGFAPAEGQLLSRQEQMLWQMVDGRPFTWQESGQEAGSEKKLTGSKAVDAAIADARKTGNHGPLLTALVEASGIPIEHLQSKLGVGQMVQWRKGQTIEDVGAASRLLGMLGAVLEGTDEDTTRQKKELLSLLTDRDFTVATHLAEARKAGNPGGDLLIRLTGRRGLVTYSGEELSQALTAAGHPASPSKVKKLRASLAMQKGGFIDESLAETVMKLVEERMKPLVENGVCPALTPEERADCIDVLTNCPHPRKMLESSVAGSYVRTDKHSSNDIGDIIRRSYERKNLRQDEFTAAVGIAKITNVVLGQSYMEHETSAKLAVWFRDHYGLTDSEQRRLMAMAQGVDVSRSADQLLDAARAEPPEIARHIALQRMYDMTGLTRPQFAKAADAAEHVIAHSATEESGGRLYCDDPVARSIAREIGISPGRIADFVHFFSGRHVSKHDALQANSRVNTGGSDGITGRG
jgi:hypothetical protein